MKFGAFVHSANPLTLTDPTIIYDPEHTLADLRVTVLKVCSESEDIPKAEVEWI